MPKNAGQKVGTRKRKGGSNKTLTESRFTSPRFTSPCFTSPRFTTLRFTSPRFTSPVQSSPIQSTKYSMPLQCFARRHSFAADMIRTNVLRETVEKLADLPCGHDEDFVNPVDDDLQCSICQLTLRNPVLTRCGHRFCRGCLEQHMSNR